MMELNSNIIALQGVVSKCSKQIGDFSKIHYKGGNEKSILYLTTELTAFLIEKGLYDPRNPSREHFTDLQDLVLFLALNTEFKKPVTHPESYSHLIGIIPTFSNCLLVNICFALDLVECLGFAIEKLPIQVTEELLDQAVGCLKGSKPPEHLKNACIILRAVANKLSLIELGIQTEDIVENITSISQIILQNLSSLSIEQLETMKAHNVYQQIGFTLLELLNLLLYVNESNKTLLHFTASLVSTTCSLIQCVTLDVFCSWVEINYEDQPLQITIAGRAYLVVEKYQKYKMASDLVSMLSTVARKPKTIAERILEADIPTMIKMIDEKDEHQKLWFRSLLKTFVFSNPQVVSCIERWWHLCDETIVDRLLSCPLPKDPKHRQLIIKCASNLSLEGLVRVLTISFNRDKFQWKEQTTDQLVLVFNHVDDNMSEKELKEMLLLLLQNAVEFYQHLYKSAFKRSSELERVFDLLQDMSKVDNIGLTILMQVLNEFPPSTQNVLNFVQMFRVMINSQYFSWSFMVKNVIFTLLNRYREKRNSEEFMCCLQILKHFQDQKCDLATEIQLFEYLLTCASESRCKSFLDFDCIGEQITSLSVDWVLHKCSKLKNLEGKRESFPDIASTLDDSWSQYYKQLLWSTEEDISLVDLVLPNFDLSDFHEGDVGESFTMLLKVLPRCVALEWKILLNELVAKYGFNTASNALKDVIVLLCDFTESQGTSDVANNALKFCLHNYGAFTLSLPTVKEEHVQSINNVCDVLRHIPGNLKSTEGLYLINALPEDVLKSLAENKEFVTRIVQVGDKELCKALAQKVLASAQRGDG